MRLRSFFHVILLLLLPVAVFATDALFVQSLPVKPYEQVYAGFRSAFSGTVTRLVLADGAVDPVRAVRDARPDVVVAVGAEALAKLREIEEVPIVYAMVLNPEPLVEDRDNITGVGMVVEAERQLAALQAVLPRASRRLGVLYDPRRSSAFIREAAAAARNVGLELVAGEVADPAAITGVVAGLTDIGALWLLPDPTVAAPASAGVVFEAAAARNLPVMTFSAKHLKEGALLSFDLDTVQVGVQAAELAAETAPGAESAPVVPPAFRAKVSRAAAERLGIQLSDALVREAGAVLVD